jgi:hypothetical protein
VTLPVGSLTTPRCPRCGHLVGIGWFSLMSAGWKGEHTASGRIGC